MKNKLKVYRDKETKKRIENSSKFGGSTMSQGSIDTFQIKELALKNGLENFAHSILANCSESVGGIKIESINFTFISDLDKKEKTNAN